VPTSITAFLFWLLRQKIIASDKERREAEEERMRCEAVRDEWRLLIMEGNSAAMKMGKANGEVLQGLKCNGNVTDAMKNIIRVSDKQKAFMQKQTIKIFDQKAV
jgi:hypothetical protein